MRLLNYILCFFNVKLQRLFWKAENMSDIFFEPFKMGGKKNKQIRDAHQDGRDETHRDHGIVRVNLPPTNTY